MIPYKTYAVVGGDLRQAHIANRLAEDGKTVYAMLLEKNAILRPELACDRPVSEVLPLCDAVVFPLPLSADEGLVNAPFSDGKAAVSECFASIRPGTAVFAGKVSPEMAELADRFGLRLTDYLQREELAAKNAVITAEGAVAIAMEELPVALFGLRCLITGHGRIAKSLMRIMRGMCADVTVAARKYGDLAKIQAEGCKAVHIRELAEQVGKSHLIFNTVPAKILTREVLQNAPKDLLLIDLASRPGGVDTRFAPRRKAPV